MQLFCLTFAGGTAAFYDPIERNINPHISVEKLEYAGHGTRHKEPFYENFEALAGDMYRAVKANLKEDYALMGYSMGSISAAEVLYQILNKNEIPAPRSVFMAAYAPCSKTERFITTDESVKKRTLQFGGIPESLVNNHSFWRMYLPIYKHDYQLIEKYRFEYLKLRTKIPVKFFYSETDTPVKEMELWKNYFTGKVELIRYEGPHFFIRNHCKEMCREIESSLGF